MKKRIIFIFALFLMLSGFSGGDRIVELNIQERISTVGVPPQILTHLKKTMVEEGETVIFTATVSTSDFLTVWYKNGVPLPVDGRFQFYLNKNVARLTIPSVFLEDAGVYTVKFVNRYGEVSSSAQLFVILPE